MSHAGAAVPTRPQKRQEKEFHAEARRRRGGAEGIALPTPPGVLSSSADRVSAARSNFTTSPRLLFFSAPPREQFTFPAFILKSPIQ
jgi:hypothetical protein